MKCLLRSLPPSLINSPLPFSNIPTLHAAAASNDKLLASLVLDLCAESVSLDLPCPTPLGWTPLHYAVASGSPEVAALILTAQGVDTSKNRGADVKSSSGLTPLQLARHVRDAEGGSLNGTGASEPGVTCTKKQAASFAALLGEFVGDASGDEGEGGANSKKKKRGKKKKKSDR